MAVRPLAERLAEQAALVEEAAKLSHYPRGLRRSAAAVATMAKQVERLEERFGVLVNDTYETFQAIFLANGSPDETDFEVMLRGAITKATGRRLCRKCVRFHNGGKCPS